MRTYTIRMLAMLCLALGVGVAQAAERGKPEVEYRLDIDGIIEINPQGGVHDYQLKTKLKPRIADLVDKAVRGWRFEPVLIDGRPVIAKTRMQLSLRAEPIGELLRLRTENVHFGGAEHIGKMTPPGYPRAAASAGVNANVMLVLRLDASGRVTDVHPYQTSLSATGRELLVKRYRELFEKASIAAARRWMFVPGQIVDGEPIEDVVMVPIHYFMRGTEQRWQGYVPGPINPIPWGDADGLASAAETAADLPDGQTVSLNSRFKLKIDPRGKLL